MLEYRHLRGAVAGVAAGGVLLGHWLTYRIVSPHEQARSALLASGGHGYLAFLNELGTILAVGVLAALVLGRLTDPGRPVRVGGWLVGLAWVQVVAFTAMEVLERLASGAPLDELMHGGLLLAGVAIQLAVAAVGAFAIHRLLGLADRVQETFARPASLRGPAGRGLAVLAATGGLSRPAEASGIRGPPRPR
jgi:hypothetical protein